jgi:hypothetical protein
MKTLSTLLTAAFAAALATVSSTTCAYSSASPFANVTSVTINYIDGAGVGFNDATLGPSRKAALQFAVNQWAATIKSTVPIIIDARCQALGGDAFSAVLANAGAQQVSSASGGVPHINTLYPLDLLNQYAGFDIDSGTNDILVTLNSDVDNSTVLGNVDFYYGTDGNPGSDVDLVSVLLHELGHGLGFLTFMAQNGTLLSGFPDVYELNLVQIPGGSLNSMSDAGRQAAQISGQLFWDGASVKNRFNTNTSSNYGNVKMYAPGTFESGSSTSHFDVSNSPDLLMEPSYTGAHHSLDLTPNVLNDVGWFLDPASLPATLSHMSAE